MRMVSLLPMFNTRRLWTFCAVLTALVAVRTGVAQEEAPSTAPVIDEAPPSTPVENARVETDPQPGSEPVKVFVIPVKNQIAPPSLYVLRRGLKEAIAEGATYVLLDMDTPGGRADVMLEMMEALEKFEGATATFVNVEAGSAGALIAAVTDEIYFAPTGVMGAAEIITGTGADVSEGLKRKLTSYINAKVRALAHSDNPHRADVLKAMTTPSFELKIDDKVLKPSGELLTLTADEAVAKYGDPPMPLLADGISSSVSDLLATRFPGQNLSVVRLQTTWSEEAAQWLNAFQSVLLGLGLLGLFIEFKTPGFGIFGVLGAALLLVVFFGHYIAGLSGHEPALVFALGLVLLALELLVIPGTILVGLVGVMLMLGSLIWSMADLWPNEPVEFSGDVFARPLLDLGLGVVIAIGGMVALLRFLPRGWVWDRLVLASAVGESAPTGTSATSSVAAPGSALVGRRGVAATALFPSGQIEIDGRRYEARLEIGSVAAGTPLVVREEGEFGLIVEPEGGAS
jgi:membrane-bound serine protease (ClpP class)